MTTEAEATAAIRLDLGKRPDVKLLRNSKGSFQNERGQWVRYGLLMDGSSDWIGFKRVTITPDMVGQTVAVLLALEIKAPGAKPSGKDARKLWDDQEKFCEFIRVSGGLAGVVRSPADARRVAGL